MTFLQENQKQRLLDIAYTIAHHGKIPQANAIFEAFLLEKPAFAPALIGKALTLLMINKFEDSEKILLEVLNTNNDDKEARAMLSLCYFLSGNSSKAKEEALKLSENDGEAYQLASSLLAELG